MRVLSVLGLVLVSSVASAADVELEGNTVSGPGNCIPFGGWRTLATGDYAGFIYQNVPAFSVEPGDTIAFDAGDVNNVPITLNIALASAVSNGSMEPDTTGTSGDGFTRVVSSGTPANPYGDTTRGNFELEFTVDTAFQFDGGGLLIRFDVPSSSAFAADVDCDQMLMFSSSWDTSGYFVGRFYDDSDGAYPWDDSDNNVVGNVHFDCPTVASTLYADSDGDGYGNSAVSVSGSCTSRLGLVSDGSDCDDTDSTVHPGADETCDTIDNDCDGTTDEPDAIDASTWYADTDADGYGDAASTSPGCVAPSGYVADDSDCDDTRSTSYPGADEYCNTVDDDCDGTTDESDAVDAATWYADTDGDGFGDALVTDLACSEPAGFVSDDTDCDDTRAATYPGADETCNTVDDNCDGTIDEDTAIDAVTWYADTDGDGYGDAAVSDVECVVPSGYVADDTDCDDSRATSYPGADEYCNTFDDDCDGTTDEDDSVDASVWYADTDGDGYGNALATDLACTVPSGFVGDDTDCDDTDPTSYPGAEEVPYDGIDQDCDSEDLCDVDLDDYVAVECGGDDCDDTDDTVHVDAEESWYDGVDQDCDEHSDYDADFDGYDSESHAGADCDDADPDTYPGAPDDHYDGEINDCDDADEYDADGDGFDSSDHGGDDCDDANSEVRPDADEIWYDGVDQDCDGADDDQDGDGFLEAEDCDDTDADLYPSAPGLDENCLPIDEDDPETDSGDTLDSSGSGSSDGAGCGGTKSAALGFGLLGLVPLFYRRRRGAE